MNTIIFNEDIQCSFQHSDTYETVFVDNFCFDKFKIVYPKQKKKVTVELKSGTRIGNAKCYFGMSNREICVEWDFENYEYDIDEELGAKNDCIKSDKPITCENDKYECFMIVQEILDACYYIMTTKRERIVKDKRETNIKSENERKKHKEYDKKAFLLDEIVGYVRENGLSIDNKGTHKINCPCWSVRGHYRHYKSGKVIFVENYKKGKERENKEPKNKTYTV